MTETPQTAAVRTWMFGPGRQACSASELLHGLCRTLSDQGISLTRANLLVHTRQPQLEMLVYIWRPNESTRVVVDSSRKILGLRRDIYLGGEVETVLLARGHATEDTYRESPFYACLEENRVIRRRLQGDERRLDYPILQDLAQTGATDYVVLPIGFPSPYRGALSLVTDASEGFSHAQVQSIQALEPIIGLGFSAHIVHQAVHSVLSTYIGFDPARRVMSGAVNIGDADELDAVIGFTDLRGFTSFSSSASTDEMTQRLTRFFSAVNRCVTSRGGEVLKFMGDGAMFVFPIGNDGASAACSASLDAMEGLQAALTEPWEGAAAVNQTPLHSSTALHVGRVYYGNIGSAERLDFTVLGSAVNLTARLESLAKRLMQPLIVSHEFAGACPSPFRSLGRLELKGVSGLTEIYAPMERQAVL